MALPTSKTDEPGYVYAYETKGIFLVCFSKQIHIAFLSGLDNLLVLKVGRTTKPNMDEWDSQCASDSQILRSWWPAGLETDSAGLLQEHVKPGPPAKYSHRLERLIHIELADLAMRRAYLDPKWLNVEVNDAIAKTEGNADDKWAVSSSKGMEQMKACPDCASRLDDSEILSSNNALRRWQKTQRNIYVCPFPRREDAWK